MTAIADEIKRDVKDSWNGEMYIDDEWAEKAKDYLSEKYGSYPEFKKRAYQAINYATREDNDCTLWWKNLEVRDTLKDARGMGWCRQPSVTQVEWTESGINALIGPSAWSSEGSKHIVAHKGGMTRTLSRDEIYQELKRGKIIFFFGEYRSLVFSKDFSTALKNIQWFETSHIKTETA